MIIAARQDALCSVASTSSSRLVRERGPDDHRGLRPPVAAGAARRSRPSCAWSEPAAGSGARPGGHQGGGEVVDDQLGAVGEGRRGRCATGHDVHPEPPALAASASLTWRTASSKPGSAGVRAARRSATPIITPSMPGVAGDRRGVLDARRRLDHGDHQVSGRAPAPVRLRVRPTRTGRPGCRWRSRGGPAAGSAPTSTSAWAPGRGVDVRRDDPGRPAVEHPQDQRRVRPSRPGPGTGRRAATPARRAAAPRPRRPGRARSR